MPKIIHIHLGSKAKDSVASAEKEIEKQQRLIDACEKNGKPVPGVVLQRMKFLKEELAKEKARTDDASSAFEEAVRYYQKVKTDSPKSRVSWQSVAKEAAKALAAGGLTGSEKSKLSQIQKEAEGLATTLPRPGTPNVGAYAHLTKGAKDASSAGDFNAGLTGNLLAGLREAKLPATPTAADIAKARDKLTRAKSDIDGLLVTLRGISAE